MSGNSSFLRCPDRDLAPRPRPCGLDRTPRSIIGIGLLEKRQKMFRTIRRPGCQETVPGKIEQAAAMDGDETPVTHTWASFAKDEARR
jgi:hypothetical protein